MIVDIKLKNIHGNHALFLEFHRLLPLMPWWQTLDPAEMKLDLSSSRSSREWMVASWYEAHSLHLGLLNCPC